MLEISIFRLTALVSFIYFPSVLSLSGKADKLLPHRLAKRKMQLLPSGPEYTLSLEIGYAVIF